VQITKAHSNRKQRIFEEHKILDLTFGLQLNGDVITEIGKSKYLTKIEVLKLAHLGQIPDPAFAKLMKFSNLTNTRELRVSFSGFGSEALKALAQSQFVTKLEVLKLDSCENLNDEAFVHFFESNTSQNIIHLDVSCADITDDGVCAFAQSEYMKKVRQLSLKSCKNVTDSGFQKLFSSINLNRLEDLNLADTSISDEGFNALVTSVFLQNLTTLKCEGCEGITKAGFKPLPRTSTLLSLKSLDLRRTSIGEEEVQALEASSLFKGLCELIVAECSELGYEFKQMLQYRLKKTMRVVSVY
jgi:Leucine-rich repeat (LRR) protein